MRVYEHANGETHACGSGACASVISGVYNNVNDKKTCVHMIGGDLHVEIGNN